MNTEPTQTLAAVAPATSCSDLPDEAGFYWWRKYPDQEWRMVHIVDFAARYPGEPPHLAAYDVEYRAWGGRTLRMWAIHDPIGEWLTIRKPNADGDGRREPAPPRQ
jgi:hypothetical protein